MLNYECYNVRRDGDRTTAREPLASLGIFQSATDFFAGGGRKGGW